VLLNVLAHELGPRHARRRRWGLTRCLPPWQRRAPAHVRGSYAVIAHIAGRGMLAFRDPFGIRPLSLGRSAEGGVMLASETVALEGTGFTPERDVAPGEAIYVTLDGAVHTRQCARAGRGCRPASLNTCTWRGPTRCWTASRSTRRA
jgi:amidophosphoribosyltransferase